MKIVIIGGTGHIGTFLVPRLVLGGHDVTVVSRAERDPYQPHGAWAQVQKVTVDRKVAEAAGEFGSTIAALEPDVVIDLICFAEDSAHQLVDALRGRVQHFMHCGTIWVHGPSTQVPTPEDAPRRPFGAYGIAKAAIERYLLDQARRNGFPATIIHPGHISGPGWPPINPAGHLDLGVFRALARGEELALPNFGLETVQHVHASDVADIFLAAMKYRSVSIGESFHSVAPGALTLRGYSELVAASFGQEANLVFLPWDKWAETVSESAAALTHDHIAHSPHCSMEKARQLLGFRPHYSAAETVLDAISALEF